MTPKNRWRSHIDGMRAVSVLAVLFYHTGISRISGGFVGVDVFFVISGFLISRIIYNDITQLGRFRIGHFYERRIRRILPVFVVVTAVTIAAGYFLFLPGEFSQLGESALYASSFAANIFFYLSSDYFGPAADTQPLLHYWSLGVEEQFYIAFPVVVFLLWKLAPKLLAPILFLIAAASICAAEYHVRTEPTAAFYLAHLRAWELIVGSILALPHFPYPRHRFLREGASAAGLALILYAVVSFGKGTSFPGFSAAIPVGGAALILWGCDRGKTIVGTALSFAPVRAVGWWSYSIYMIHWPLIVFGKQYWPDGGVHLMMAVIVLSIALGCLSYYFVEKPFHGPRQIRLARGQLFAGAISAVAVLIVAGTFVHATGGWASRLPKNVRDVLAYNHYRYSEIYRRGECFLENEQAVLGEACLIADSDTILLWGDSHAADLYKALDRHFRRSGFPISQASMSSCAPMMDYKSPNPNCNQFNERVLNWVQNHKPKAIILAAYWPLWETDVPPHLDKTVHAIRRLNIPVVIIGQAPAFQDTVPNILARRLLRGQPSEAATAKERTGRAVNGDRAMLAHYRAMSGVTYVSFLETLCENGCPLMADDQTPLYWDRNHFTLAGAKLAVRKMLVPHALASREIVATPK